MEKHAWSWARLLALRLAARHQRHLLARWLLENAPAVDANPHCGTPAALVVSAAIARGAGSLPARASAAGEPTAETSAANARQHGEVASARASSLIGQTAPPFEVDVSHWNIARRQADLLVRMGLKLVPPWRFPPSLQALPSLPPMLFVWGDVNLLSQPGVGIVGSRRASADGVRWATGYAKRVGSEGKVVISGGARGIDTAAHQGALQTGARTIAYVGARIDSPYPSLNKPLFTDMVATGGAVVSEYPPGEITYKSAHALRNRFIAAHAAELTVVEAAAGSGTLCTADWARRLGTPVWVSPEGVGREREGLRLLLEQGDARAHPY